MGSFSVNRPVSVLMLTFVMILFGTAAYFNLPSDLFPEVSQPGLMVRTHYEGAASSQIEQTVTKKLEEKLGSVKNLVAMKSISGEERSDISLTFGWGTEMDLAAMDVRAKLDEVGDDLPDDAEDPVVLRTSSGSAAIMVLNVAANARAPKPVDEDDLREEVEKFLKPRLERINGVAAISIAGGKQYEVRVKVKPARLASHGLSILDVQDALERENLSQRGGKLKQENTQFLIRTVGSFTIQELKRLLVSSPGQKRVELGQVADLEEREVEKAPESFARLRTGAAATALPSVEVSILKKSGGNSVAICEAVRRTRLEVLFDLAKRDTNPPDGASEEAFAQLGTFAEGSTVPPELASLKEYVEKNAPFEAVVSYDESVFISESLDMVKSNGLQGLILASIILLVFLRRIQSTVIVVLSMPVSVIATFSLFYAGDISLNIFSMAGLTLAVGMVVDNAIVVTEAIFHKLSYERRVKKAITEAVTEIGPAVWASTLTTMAVFLPIVFVPGIAGQIFRDLSWVITYTLFFSIIVAFTLIPMLTMNVMNIKFALFDMINKGIEVMLWPLSALAVAVTGVYKKVLRAFISSIFARLLLVGAMGVIFIFTLCLLPPSEFFPETKVESYALTIRPRVGQTLEKVNQAALRVESMFAEVKDVARFNVSVTPREIRLIATFDKEKVMADEIVPLRILGPVIERIGQDPKLADIVLDYKVESLNPMKNLLGTGGGDIVLNVRGPDLKVLHEILIGPDGDSGIVQKMREQKAALGIATIGKTEAGVPEWVLRIKRDAAADRGLTLAAIADQVETAVAGTKATDITIRDTTYDIVLSSGATLKSKRDLLDLDIMPPAASGITAPVKLREVVALDDRKGHLAIYHEERERSLYVPIFIDKERAALGEVVGRLQAVGGVLDSAREQYRKDGYRLSLGGSSEAMDESLGYMLYAFVVAIVLVYMVMASQFESLIHPFTIMFSVPLSLIGAVLGLVISGDALSLTAMIGIIMLAGIVVNNAIILIDYINILRARGQVRNDAIVEAGITRMRPILMTTLTTVLGMAPLALGYGTGAELYKPLAVVVVGGLGFSTLLTLIFIPAVYCFADDVQDLVGFVGFRISLMFAKRG